MNPKKQRRRKGQKVGSRTSAQNDQAHGKRLQKSDSKVKKKHFRWALELLHTAVCGHRWEDALLMLPCVITQMAPHLPVDFLWRMTDVITRNIPGISEAERKKFWPLVHNMKVKPYMFLDILSQDLARATEKDTDELLQMIEDIQNHRLYNLSKGKRRFQALSDGYIGLIHYNRWKNSVAALSSSLKVDPDDDLFPSSFPESKEEVWSEMRRREIARKAHSILKKALSNLDEPCEWFMMQYLELEAHLNGQEAAVSALEKYKADPRRAPAHHLAHCFYKTFTPASTERQLVELEAICKKSPDDPLVVELVNLYLAGMDHGGPALERAMVFGSGGDSDSGLEDSDTPLSAAPSVVTCSLKSRGHVEALYRCLVLLVGLLDFEGHRWDLAPWQKLTEVLAKFYQAWVRCYTCLSCHNTRRRLHRLAETVVPLWRHSVWRPPPPLPRTLTQAQAQVIVHHVFAAFIFGHACEKYQGQCLSALEVGGHTDQLEELLGLLSFPGAHRKDFMLMAERNRKRFPTRRHHQATGMEQKVAATIH
ncbi:uncharacterized protein LOC126995172 [Eriocheir sinensis]|uniref:uncharacterized protein LOC126995172 n=1 Tax=Eriocheir sinensis TaxID=95602 RepID=UPI0021C7ADFB|nr:uncharacterized protein LOC126995172 [Eriocheir sinensis]